MGYYQTQAPDGEPLTPTEARASTRVDVSDDDVLITSHIAAVREHVEQITARSLMTQKQAYVIDSFYQNQSGILFLEKGPITSIDSINYLAMDGTTQVMPPTDYRVDLSGQLARIMPRFGKIWPITIPEIACITVNFTAGYGLAKDVPEGIKQWMRLRLGTFYENREDVLVGSRIIVVELPFVESLLDKYRIVRA